MKDDWAADDLTEDEFLGGQLRITQPRRGYRAGIDPVLLAASVAARPGETVLDLGCGVGVAALCLGRRIEGVQLHGLELQPGYAALAHRNATANDLKMEVTQGDLSDLPTSLRERQFDHVIANPPYFDRTTSTRATDAGRETALGEATPLRDWIRTAAKRTRPKGHVTFVQRAERLPEMMAHATEVLGSLEVLPLIPRKGRAARLVLIRGRRGGRAGFRLHDGWILHEGDTHDGDRENYNTATSCILRLGAALPFSSAM